jgi:hypothetical protein
MKPVLLSFVLLASCVHAPTDAGCAHPTTGRIVGQVVDHRGRPVAGAGVALTADDGDVAYNFTSDKNGRFDLGCLSAADYTVSSGRSSTHVRLHARERADVTLRVW